MVNNNKFQSRTCTPKHAGEYKFEVTQFENRFVVDLQNRDCSCRYWNITSIPCAHAIACIHWTKHDPVTFVTDWLKKDAYQLAYSHGIPPMNGKNFWNEVTGSYVFPPLTKRHLVGPSEIEELTSARKKVDAQHCPGKECR